MFTKHLIPAVGEGEAEKDLYKFQDRQFQCPPSLPPPQKRKKWLESRIRRDKERRHCPKNRKLQLGWCKSSIDLLLDLHVNHINDTLHSSKFFKGVLTFHSHHKKVKVMVGVLVWLTQFVCRSKHIMTYKYT